MVWGFMGVQAWGLTVEGCQTHGIFEGAAKRACIKGLWSVFAWRVCFRHAVALHSIEH